jgi:hypothetical protein
LFEDDVALHKWYYDISIINSVICKDQYSDDKDENLLKGYVNIDDWCDRQQVRYIWGDRAEKVIDKVNEIGQDFKIAIVSNKIKNYKKLEKYIRYPVYFAFHNDDLGIPIMEKYNKDGEKYLDRFFSAEVDNFDEFVKYLRMTRKVEIQARKDRGFDKIEGMRYHKRYYGGQTISMGVPSFKIYIACEYRVPINLDIVDKKIDFYEMQNSLKEEVCRVFDLRTSEFENY